MSKQTYPAGFLAVVGELTERIMAVTAAGDTMPLPAIADEMDDIAAAMRALVRQHQPRLSWPQMRQGFMLARTAAGIAAQARGYASA